MKKLLSSAAVAIALAASPSYAATFVNISSTPYDVSAPAGPFLTLEAPTFTGGSFVTGTIGGQHEQPAGSGGLYWSVGPTDGTPGYLALASNVKSLTFLWGSIDTYNSINVLGAGDALLDTIFGVEVGPPANGDPGAQATNRWVTLDFSNPNLLGQITRLEFISDTNAFETTNFLTSVVPEPSTWALMILGIGAVGASLRRGRQKVSVSYA